MNPTLASTAAATLWILVEIITSRRHHRKTRLPGCRCEAVVLQQPWDLGPRRLLSLLTLVVELLVAHVQAVVVAEWGPVLEHSGVRIQVVHPSQHPSLWLRH